MKLGNIKISVKLIVGFLIVAAITAIVGAIGIRNMGTISGMADAMYLREVLGLAYVKDANIDLIEAARAEKNLILSITDEERQAYKQQHADSLKKLDDNIALSQPLILSDAGKELLAKLMPQVAAWKGVSQRVVDTALTEDLSQDKASAVLSMGEARDKINLVNDTLTALTKIKEANAKSFSDEATAIYRSSLLVMILLVIGGVLFGVAIGLILTFGITRPLNKGVAFAQRVADGDFTKQLDVHQKDEAGVLADALNGMAQKLKDMVATVQENAEQVASSSEEISASAQKLAEGSQSQASTLEETSASIEELTASVDQVAEHAQSQASAVEQGSSSMTQVQKSIDEVSSSLNGISDIAKASVEGAMEGAKAVHQVVDGINLIAASSEKIGGIVNVISDIADQTNLLALNASIEAARAGEHGRGFAVVADEVSKLADRSAASTKEIDALIKESVRNVTEGVKTAQGAQATMEKIRVGAQEANEMIGALSESMSQQVTAVHQLSTALSSVAEMSQSISASTEEQTTNAKQVSKAVENVNELTQSAASAAEEMSSATEQLSSMAQELQRLMAQFQIGDGNGSGNGNGKATPQPKLRLVGGNENGNGKGNGGAKKARNPALASAKGADAAGVEGSL